ncbi:MAG: HTTM domain-containing protein [Verrucomicrobiales bacterium]|nr:HTTM domain-containing protein [Verrucomicrobiales bacterium]
MSAVRSAAGRNASWWGGLADAVLGYDDGRRLRWFEVCFTVQFAVWMGLLALHPVEWLGETGFDVDLSPVRPGLGRALPRLPWVGVWVFLVLLTAGVALVLANHRWKRLGLVLCLGSAVYVRFADHTSVFTLSSLNVLVFFILATAPSRGGEGETRVCVTPVRLCQGLLIILYFTAGLAKAVHGDWWEHEDVILTFMQGKYRTDLAAFLVRTMPLAVWSMLRIATLVFELGAPVWFGVRRLRPVGLLVGLIFHVFIALTLASIWPFSLHCISYYPLFFPRRWLGMERENAN